MGLSNTTQPDPARVLEVDAYLRRFNQALALAAALIAPLFVAWFGLAFAGLLMLPLLWWGFRAAGATEWLGLERWIIGLLAIVSITITGAASASGGSTSPVMFFASIIGIGAQAYFPHRRWTAIIGILIVAAITGCDLVLDRPLDFFSITLALMLASYLPFIVQRLVDLEQLHRRSAVVDALTGCLNRRSLETRIEELEAHAERTHMPIAIISFDLDHFKRVNDDHGHAAGDAVLEHVAYVVRKQLRRFELFYRLGGEEFAILLPDTDLASATSLAERLCAAVAADSTGGVPVTASFGVSCAASPLSVESILAKADEHLYDAKRSGRNRVAHDRGDTTDHPHSVATR
ncbi:MAG: GGDEF domain-containing protein [Ilumatobacter sp.]|uniref:GGDEF domain-containing protein n=1 Tax=Ilumatobacter sp. TaxID=1967498 RepID=UPI003C778AAC